MDDRHVIVTLEQRPDLRAEMDAVNIAGWPEFMLHDEVADRLWHHLLDDFPAYQFALLIEDRVVATGNSLPLAWSGEIDDLPDEGWDWAMERGVDDLLAGREPNLQCAIAITIAEAHRGRGHSARMVAAMKEIGQRHGLGSLIAPVRPNLKSRYPLTPIDRYIHWQREDRLPFDPWMRVHARLGARIVKPCHRSMRIAGSPAEWEEWTDMRFPDSGPYVIPGALVPIDIDRNADRGLYVEPNVWMHHSS